MEFYVTAGDVFIEAVGSSFILIVDYYVVSIA
jgi:hypothetical protein